jgi:hypothetical protein
MGVRAVERRSEEYSTILVQAWSQVLDDYIEGILLRVVRILERSR